MKSGFKIVSILEILTGVGIILFWIGFFTVGLAPENPPACYFAFEHSFPLPDVILALALIYSGILIRQEKPLGASLGLTAAGGLIFLGVIDFSFNIQNGMYLISIGDMITNGFINLWCAGFGIYIFFKLGLGQGR